MIARYINFKHDGYHKVNCISKDLGYRNTAKRTRRHEDVITEVPSLLREVRLRLERCWDHTRIPKAPNRLTLFSRERTGEGDLTLH